MALRHEWKHRIDTAGLLALRGRLGAVLQRDPHALGGSYQVRMKDENTDFINILSEMNGVQSAVLVSYNGDYMG